MRRKFLNYLKFIALYTIAAVAVGAGALVAAYPLHPNSAVGWIVWFLFALPVYVFLEFIGAKIFSKKIGYKIDDSEKNVSVTRIAFAFALAVAAMLIATIFVFAAGTAAESFWEVNFSSTW